jgi:hypothetical protein
MPLFVAQGVREFGMNSQPPELKVKRVPLVRAWCESPPSTWVYPGFGVWEQLPTLWTILHNCHDDWRSYSKAHPLPRDLEENLRIDLVFEAMDELRPRFIQCLFSYVNFFFLMETGFWGVSDEMKKFYKKLGIEIKAAPEPERCSYIDRLRVIRNTTVVHWGQPISKRKGPTPDDHAGRHWGGSWSTNDEDLYDFNFGGMVVPGAVDRKLLPFRETHRICTEYLRQYDEHCASLLLGLEPHLPRTVDGVRYEFVDPYKEIRRKAE